MASSSVPDRFRHAARILTEESGDLKERLLVAFTSQLLEIDPQTDLPAGLRDRYGRLRVQLTQDEVVGDTGNVACELEKMSDAQASRIVDEILAMSRELSSAERPSHGAEAR